MSQNWINLCYLVSIIFFIFGIKRLGAVKTARQGNSLAILGMLIATLVTFVNPEVKNYAFILGAVLIGTVIGAIMARVVKMTDMPQMVAIFNGFGGLASALVAGSAFLNAGASNTSFALITILLSTFIGALTFTGSFVAFGKLQGFVSTKPMVFPMQKTINLLLTLLAIYFGGLLVCSPMYSMGFWAVLSIALLLGVLLVIPIGGADMPVVISLLNSYSGVAASITGFVLMNNVLIVAGAIVGAAGLILTMTMCRAMNRSLANVAFGTFGKIEEGSKQEGDQGYSSVKSCTPEEAALVVGNAQSVIIVPGYGLAVARAQHILKELANLLESRGASVKYAIHPVAGRMPGHMNVLLAEADVPYDQLYEMEDINSEFEQTDLALVIGANDVINPVARTDPGSPIYGMPILEVFKARSAIIIKRSLSPGFAGIKNPLFEDEKTLLMFDDARKGVEQLVKEVKAL